MPNSVTKRRTRTALLATIAMLASVFVFPLTAQADVKPPEKLADWSSCVAAATADAGFTDTSGSFAEASIDCIAHYGITTGTSATTYSPADVVSRWQMALFLTRAAGPAGITLPAATDQGFTDIGGLSQATQDAINQLAALGISKGTSATTYSPDSAVTRQQMALFLIRFLADAEPLLASPADHPSGFTDTNGVSFEAHNAIEDAFDYGITTGTTATTFSPNANVTREQMAAFIARTLAHTNARPAGLSMQVSSTAIVAGGNVDVHIALRDANHAPIVNGLVDLFEYTAANAAKAFKTDGTCDLGFVVPFVAGTACTVELGEATATGPDGNIDVNSGALFTSWTFVAWTGSAGDEFDKDTVTYESEDIAVSAAPSYFIETTNVPANAIEAPAGGGDDGNLVKYGTTVTHTFQLYDTDDKPLAKAGVKVTADIYEYVGGVEQSFSNDVLIGTTDASGKFTVSWTKSDPTAGADNDPSSAVRVEDVTSGALGFDDTAMPNDDEDIVWDDNTSAAETLVLSQGTKYTVASASGSGAVNSVSATLYDQYGLGMAGETIDFWATGDLLGIGGADIERTTNSSGTASLAYNRDSALSGLETINADHDGAVPTAAPMAHYWVIEESAGAKTDVASAILIADTANDTLVVLDGGDYVFLEYDANDQFSDPGAVTYAAFDKDVVAGDLVDYTYDPDAADVSTFTLS